MQTIFDSSLIYFYTKSSVNGALPKHKWSFNKHGKKFLFYLFQRDTLTAFLYYLAPLVFKAPLAKIVSEGVKSLMLIL